MVKQNYLDIYPGNGIAERLNNEKFYEDEPLKQLIEDVNQYVATVEQENVEFLYSRNNNVITSAETLRFFRSQERTRNIRLMLQYMVTFLVDKLPMKEDIEEKLVNPFDQFKSFCIFSAGLLKEPDVTTAILREHERLGLLNETNAWYYRGQINKNYKQVMDVLESAHEAVHGDYCKLFEAVQRMSLFWFSVRNEDIRRVRKSDIFIYKLSFALQFRSGCIGNG